MNLQNKLKATSQLLNRANDAGRRVLSVPLENVAPDPEQVRKIFDQESLEGLAKSLLETGQLEPIVVSPKDSNGIYVIQKGERRYRASKLAGLDKIDVIVNESNLSELTLRIEQLVENIQREDLEPIEIGRALATMSESGLAGNEIADKLGKSEAWVSLHLAVGTAKGLIKDLIEAGKVADATVVHELGRLQEERPAAFKTYCKKVLATEGMMASRAEIRSLRKGKTTKPAKPKKRTYKFELSEELEASALYLSKQIKSSTGKKDLWGALSDSLTDSLSGQSKEDLEGVIGVEVRLVRKE